MTCAFNSMGSEWPPYFFLKRKQYMRINKATCYGVQVCAAAGVDRSSVVYVEAHGTGTVVGDAQELAAIDRMYGAGAGRTAAAPLLIGSVKSNMGHCEGCSGLAGAFACIQASLMSTPT